MTRSKAFFLNGGAGRMLCSIPALELYAEESGDTDFIIVTKEKNQRTQPRRLFD